MDAAIPNMQYCYLSLNLDSRGRNSMIEMQVGLSEKLLNATLLAVISNTQEHLSASCIEIDVFKEWKGVMVKGYPFTVHKHPLIH